jgi:3-oxoacyl-[acyl-carrier protein] reductase
LEKVSATRSIPAPEIDKSGHCQAKLRRRAQKVEKNMGKLVGQIAVVTGASRGIGREIALAFAREGADVVCNYNRSEQHAQSLVREIESLGRSAIAVRADVAHADQVEQLVSSAMDRFGRIDITVNNAGFATLYKVVDMPIDAWDALVAAHLRGTFLTCRAVLPQMLERKDGRIINIASQLAYKGRSGWAHYSAAKAGIIAFTRVLAHEVSREGIRVNCIAPGPIATDIVPPDAHPVDGQSNRILEDLPLGRIGTVEEVAPTAVFLASNDSTYYVGQTLGPNGGDVML